MRGSRCWTTQGLDGVLGKLSVGCRLLLRLGGFLDAMNILIWNFPTKVTALAALFDVLLKKNGSAGVGGKKARSRQENIAHTILYGDLATQKMRIRRHLSESGGG